MKKLIFGFSDPGGANQIAAIVNCLNNEKYIKKIRFRVLTDKNGYKHKDLLPYLETVESELDRMEKFILDFQPDQIFTTASLFSYIEHNLIKLAKKHGIKSMTFLDHWTGYYEKFFREGEAHFPDLILLSDNRAKEIAIEQGLPRERLRIVGNLFYENLMSYSPCISRKEFYNYFDIDINKKIILFISDSISEQNGGYKASMNRFGFNEISIFTSVLKGIHKISEIRKINPENFVFLVKLHPKEDIAKYNHLIANSPLSKCIIIQSPNVSNHEVLYYSDFHIGMFSSMVLESVILGKQVLRVEINNTIGDLINIDKKYFKYILNESELTDGLLWLLNHSNYNLQPKFQSKILNYIIND